MLNIWKSYPFRMILGSVIKVMDFHGVANTQDFKLSYLTLHSYAP